MEQIPVLVTERVILRPFTSDDVYTFADTIFANTEVMRTLPENRLETTAQHLQFAREYLSTFTEPWERFGWGGWAVTLKDDTLGKRDQLIGFCGFLRGKLSDVHPEIAYGIGQPWWRKRITSEAARASVDWLFNNTFVTKIWGVTYKDNIGSQKVLQSVGMVYDGDINLYNSISEGRGLMPYFFMTSEMYKQQLAPCQ